MLKKVLLQLCFFGMGFGLYAQSSAYVDSIKAERRQTDEMFSDLKNSPLNPEEVEIFKGLEYYPIDSNYRVKAKFIRTENSEPFEMPTTTTRRPVYEKYGELHFYLDTVYVVLEVFQSHRLRKMKEFKDHLFLPFKDLSNSEESYGGGRYLDMSIPTTDSVIIDFNLAYNPYCAYNDNYSCPIPPPQNFIEYPVRAGVKDFKKR